MRSESCSFIWHPKVVTWYRAIAEILRRRGANDRRALYWTVRVPFMPACSCASTLQKKV